MDDGEALLGRLAADLTRRFGRGFSKRNLEQMRLFYQAWPLEHIAQTVSAQLAIPVILQTPSERSGRPPNLQTPSGESPDLPQLASAFPLPWSAYVRLLSVRNPQARAFYQTEAQRTGWSVRQLDRQISSQFYERSALSHEKAAMLEKSVVACHHAGASYQGPLRPGVPQPQGRVLRVRPRRCADSSSGRLSAGTW